MSLRRTSYVAPNPPRGSTSIQQRKMAVCRQKVHITWRKSAIESFLNIVSDRVVRHSLAYLFVQKWFAKDVPYYVKIGRNWPIPFKNADFQSVFTRGTSAVTPNGKVQLSRIGTTKSTTSFPINLRSTMYVAPKPPPPKGAKTQNDRFLRGKFEL